MCLAANGRLPRCCGGGYQEIELMNKLAFATLVAMGMTTAAIAQQSQPGQSPGRAAQPSTQQPRETPSSREATPAPRGGDRTDQVSFETADKNADGRVNREEANQIDGFDFSRADTNADAALTRQEFQAAMATSTPRGDGRPEARDSDRTAKVSFDTADKNKDGKVNRDEANDIPGFNFTAADVNDDAALSRQEFQTAMAGAQPRG
jgi:Ca2+-binding EF-hand superfamily protein